MKAGSWLNLLAGVWLLISPLTVELNRASATNNVIAGILVVLSALSSLAVAPEDHAPAWINLVTGLWLFVSAWLLGLTTLTAIWSNAIAGVLIVGFALIRMASNDVAVTTK